MSDEVEVVSPAQPFLFDDMAEEPELVERVRQFLHTGRTALRNEPRCRAIVGAVLQGAPKRAIMRHYRVGYETVEAVYSLFESSGKLRTLKEEMRRGWASILMLTHWRLQEKLLDDEMPSQVLPALAGIGTDKLLALTDCEPEEPAQKTIDITPGAVREAVRRARARPRLAAATDSESVASNAQVIENTLHPPTGAALDTPLDTPLDTLDAAPAPPDMHAEGGGRVDSSPPQDDRWAGSKVLES